MFRFLYGLLLLPALALPGLCQEVKSAVESPVEQEASTEEDAIRKRLTAYVEAFNTGDAAAVAAFWTTDGVSVAAETGSRVEGREAIQQEMARIFEGDADPRLTGEVTNVRKILPNVVVVDGMTSFFLPDEEPVDSTFTAILVKEGDQWQISSSHERDLPAPATPYDALKELEWMVGSWEDDTSDALVETSVRWTANQAFLIRSFSADFGDGEEGLHGTQVIGWDPLNKQIRTWTFNSDGSFGQGTISRHDDEWVVKMSQTLGDGRIAAGTKILSRIDDNTITVQTVGETIEGEPVPVREPVTVVRVAEPETPDEAATDEAASENSVPGAEAVPEVKENAAPGAGEDK